jgi:glyceraldehyde-3-phosphate dehydrogenase (NADP+)
MNVLFTCGGGRMPDNQEDNLETKLHRAFPAPDEIPPEYRLDTTGYERLYLVDGQIRTWEGALTEVSSPICLKNGEMLSRPVIGHIPSMDEAAAMAGLEAAVGAWDNGRGIWPTMSVSKRIAAVENFVTRMLQVRDEVVKLLMWEIGKSLEDSHQEFDRTIEYIRRTIEALKEVDRANSRFSLEEG